VSNRSLDCIGRVIFLFLDWQNNWKRLKLFFHLKLKKRKMANTLSDFFFYWSAQFARPLWHCHRVWQQYLRRPLNPGHWDQSSNRALEVTKRSLAILFSIPILLAISICTPISFALHKIAICLQHHSYHHFALGHGKNGSIFKLTCFSLNICGHLGGQSLLNGNVLPWNDRLESIVSAIQEQDTDFVCLQEVFDYRLAQQLMNQMKKQGYVDFYYNIGNSSILKLNSGLFVASKHTIENPDFSYFTTSTGRSHLMTKGVFSFSIGNCLILTTHLQHSIDDIHPSEDEMTTRKSQIATILEKIHRQSSKTPILLVGDLNVCEKEFSQVLAPHFYSDYLVNRPHAETWFGYTLESKLWNKPAIQKRDVDPPFIIDHACMYRNQALNLSHFQTMKIASDLSAFPLSDHHGLRIEWQSNMRQKSIIEERLS
jgi:exonuclease III